MAGELPTDDSAMKLNDVVLIVKGQKFNCSKANLSEHAEFFKNKFFSDDSEDKDKPEVTLEEPKDPEQFDAFLKVIKMKRCLTDMNVEDVLALSIAWQAPIVEERCIEFLTTDSKMTSVQKFSMAIKLNSEALKKQVLSGFKTIESVHKIIPENRSSWDDATTSLVFERSLELTGWEPQPTSDQLAANAAVLMAALERGSHHVRTERRSVPEEGRGATLADILGPLLNRPDN